MFHMIPVQSCQKALFPLPLSSMAWFVHGAIMYFIVPCLPPLYVTLPLCLCPVWPQLGVPLGSESVPTSPCAYCELCACVSCSVSCDPAPTSQGAHVAWVHGPVGHGPVPVQCLPPWAAGAPCPGLPQLPPGLSLASLHSRGRVPPASPAIGLKWPSGPPSTRDRVATRHSQDHPAKAE